MLPGMCMQVPFFSEQGEQEARQKHLLGERSSLKQMAWRPRSPKGRPQNPLDAD